MNWHSKAISEVAKEKIWKEHVVTEGARLHQNEQFQKNPYRAQREKPVALPPSRRPARFLDQQRAFVESLETKLARSGHDPSSLRDAQLRHDMAAELQKEQQYMLASGNPSPRSMGMTAHNGVIDSPTASPRRVVVGATVPHPPAPKAGSTPRRVSCAGAEEVAAATVKRDGVTPVPALSREKIAAAAAGGWSVPSPPSNAAANGATTARSTRYGGASLFTAASGSLSARGPRPPHDSPRGDAGFEFGAMYASTLKSPSQKYPMPVTESQELGWLPAIQPTYKDRFMVHQRKLCDMTRFAEKTQFKKVENK